MAQNIANGPPIKHFQRRRGSTLARDQGSSSQGSPQSQQARGWSAAAGYPMGQALVTQLQVCLPFFSFLFGRQDFTM